MEIVIATGEAAGRRARAEQVAQAGYDPVRFLVEFAKRGWRWHIAGLEQEPAEVRQAWSLANMVGLVWLALREQRTVRVGAERWEADPDRFGEQLQQIEDAIVGSGHHVYVLAEPRTLDEPGDLVIGLGAPE